MQDPCYYRISVKGLVVAKDGRFLLSKESNGMWEIPGGGLEHDEEPKTCLAREIYEETGLNILKVSSYPIYFITTKRLGHETYIANLIYEISLESLDFVESEECVELKFFTKDEALKEKLFPNVTEFIKVFDPKNHPAIF